MIRPIEKWLDNYKLKRKLQIFYLACVLIPLIITDSIILHNLFKAENIKAQYAMQNEAEAVRYNITSAVEYAYDLANNIYVNRYLYEFLDCKYETPYNYIEAYQDFLKTSLFHTNMGIANMRVTLYADNETLINGGEFSKLSRIKDSEWYKYLLDSGKESVLYIGFDEENRPVTDGRRKIYYVKKMDLYKYNGNERIIKVELDYSSIVRHLQELHYENEIYICMGDKILLSNKGHSNVAQEFETFAAEKPIGYEVDFTYFSFPMTIRILREPIRAWILLKENILSVLILVLINVVFPWIFSVLINNSLTRRMWILGDAFKSVTDDHLTEIKEITGKDELSGLMTRYNQMAQRTNDLIQRVYIGTIREQEMEISRKNAELLALQSQINPHFMFNTLESIRMHSVLKQEFETADMVEKLAVMERQIVNWNEDVIELQKEMDFVNAYLSLQKYRYGEKLSYEIDMDEACRKIRIPKLTVVTFVENACVHGLEQKTSRGWVFVRAYLEKNILNLEIEDTGGGIGEEEAAQLLYDMEHADIRLLKEKRSVGIVNACLRLKMVMGEGVSFQITSEEEIGTMINIRILLKQGEMEEQSDAESTSGG